MPMVRARAELETMRPGQVLEVVATDPMAELDLAVMCERTVHRLLDARTDNGVLRVRIEAGQGSRAD